ncbi:MAG TPA: GNVR domain-containing protein [Vicinamibacterales bacterium]
MLPGRVYTVDDIGQMIRRRAWVIVVPVLLAAAVTGVVLTKMPDRFRSDTLILVVPQRVPESYVQASVTTRIEDRLQSISQQLLSRTRLERTILDFDLYALDRQSMPMEDVVEGMRGDIQVQIVKGDAFRVSYVADSPAVAQRVTARLSSMFIEENLRDREVLAEATNEFLDTQLADARRRLVEQEQQLALYRVRHAGQLPSQLQSNLQAAQNLQLQTQGLVDSTNRDRDRRLVLERMVMELESRPGGAAAPPAGAGDVPDARSLEEQLESLRQSADALQVRLKPRHPDMVRTRLLIRELEERIAAEPKTAGPSGAPVRASTADSRRLETLKAEMETLDLQIAEKERRQRVLFEQIGRYDARIAAVPARESELAALTRDYDTLQKVYADLLSKREQSKVAANLERRQIGEQFTVLDPARLPEKPFSPNRPLVLLVGLIAGLVLGGGLAGWLEYRDTSLRSPADVAATLALPVLAVVPDRSRTASQDAAIRRAANAVAATAFGAAAAIVSSLGGWPGRGQGSTRVFRGARAARTDAPGPLGPSVGCEAGDAYCRVAVELHQLRQSRSLSVLMIASAEPGEGKSLTAANLGVALGASYRQRVLLVDADLRKPTLHTLLEAKSAPGLSDSISNGHGAWLQPVRMADTLSLLSAGDARSNPLVTLTSPRLKDLLAQQGQRADWVILDGPPLAAFPDGHVLASLADGIIVVVGAGQTPLAAVEAAVKMVGRERIVGIVLNRSTVSPRVYYEYQGRAQGVLQRCSRFFCRA